MNQGKSIYHGDTAGMAKTQTNAFAFRRIAVVEFL